LGAAAAELGLDVCETTVRPGRNTLRITLAGGPGPGLLLLGHTDVAPVGEGWTKDPFGGAVENGRIYGRGASDMKGGLAASLGAMAALRSAGLSGPVELAALVDEEETGAGIRAYVESVNARFLGCVTVEPTDLQTVVGARGASYLRVEIHGIACLGQSRRRCERDLRRGRDR
jgi:acetylornithine deacetylase/succinyl-diaminopimelate desuccinylase-like protein